MLDFAYYFLTATSSWSLFCVLVWKCNLIYILLPLCQQAIREQLVQLMFETFNISGFYASEQAVLSLYAVGRISGCTVDVGHGKIGNCIT